MPRTNPDLWTICAEPDCKERATTLTGPMCLAHWCIVPDCEERAAKTGVYADGRCEQHLTWQQGGREPALVDQSGRPTISMVAPPDSRSIP